MNNSGQIKACPPRLRRCAWALVAVWTIIISASLAWNALYVRKDILEMARIHARSAYEKDVIYRRWNANNKGVYVFVTEETQPNPYLSDVPERDITTLSGKLLTLINPAYMTRQVHELMAEEYGILGHITSLNPVRPENASDTWETAALRAFQHGQNEVSSVETMKGKDYMRLMRPLIVEKGCLECHARQEYTAGDIIGGISVSIPMSPLLVISRMHMLRLALVHGLLWLIGIGGIAFWTSWLGRDEQERKRVEEALRESEERYRLIFENVNDGISIYENFSNGARKLVDCNVRYTEMSGYSREELMQIGDTTGIQEVDDALEQDAVRVEQPYSGVFSWIRPDGRENYMEYTASFLNIGGRKFTVGIDHNITDRKQAEEALRESEGRYRALVETSQDLIWRCDKEGRFTYLNRAWEWTLGYSQDEMIGHAFYEFQIDSVIERDREEFESHIEGGHVSGHETVYISKSGDEIHLVFNAIPLKDSDGNIVGTQGTAYDITERRRAEEKLRQLSSAVEQSPASVVITDLDGNIQYVNPKFCELTGYSSEEAVGQNSRVLKSGEQPPEFYADMWKTIVAGKEWRGEFHNKKKNGVLYWESVSISPIRNSEGAITHFVAVKEDITEKKRMEAELLKAQKLESIGVLAGGIAHDLNNLLTGVMGNISLAMMHENPADKNRILAKAEKATMRIAGLTQQLLTFSKGGAPIIQMVAIGGLLKDSAAFTLQGSNVSCEFSIP